MLGSGSRMQDTGFKMQASPFTTPDSRFSIPDSRFPPIFAPAKIKMKFFIIRYTKIIFTYLRLHVVFNWLSSVFLNFYYLTKFSLWASKNRKIPYNDFPSKLDYFKRFELYKWVLEKENLFYSPINYMEFGVAQGASFRWFLQQNNHSTSRFNGFDTFTGLPEDFGPYKKGTFNNQNSPPEVNDSRAKFYQGLFQQTLPGLL